MGNNKNTNDENIETVEVILSKSDQLDTWKTEFTENIYVRLEAGKSLTEKQEEKLDQIFRRVVG